MILWFGLRPRAWNLTFAGRSYGYVRGFGDPGDAPGGLGHLSLGPGRARRDLLNSALAVQRQAADLERGRP